MDDCDSSALLNLYLQIAPAELLRWLQRQSGKIVRNGIYSVRLVIWMMMNQRLQAASEQALAEQSTKHVPAGSVIIGDRNFGIFSVAYHAQQQGHGILVRLTLVCARKLARGAISRAVDQPVEWRTSACNILLDGYPKILVARGAKQQQQELEGLIDLVARCKLPRRTKRRSYPRAVWRRGFRFPIRKAGKTKG